MPVLSSSSQESLIQIARKALEEHVKHRKTFSCQPQDSALTEPGTCFVTLRKKGELRGCVGVLKVRRPLFEEVISMIRASASEDPRFAPVSSKELGEVEIEISVLSPLEQIQSLKEIEVGKHGILIDWKGRSGAFLPEVAVEMGWSAEEFVKACALEKAYLPEPVLSEALIYRFTTQKIKEKRKEAI